MVRHPLQSNPSLRLQRYILRQLVVAFVIAVIAVNGAIWVSGSLNHLKYVLDFGMPLTDYLYLNLMLFPVNFTSTIMPCSVIAVLFVYNRLAADREMICMQAAGIANSHLLLPAIYFAAIVTAILAVQVSYLGPFGFRELRDKTFETRHAGLALDLRADEFNSVAETLTIYVGRRSGRRDYEDVLVWERQDPDQPLTLIAERAKLIDADGVPFMILIDGNQQTHDRREETVTIAYFEQYTINLTRYMKGGAERQRGFPEVALTDLVSLLHDESGSTIAARAWQEIHTRFGAMATTLASMAVALGLLVTAPLNRRGQILRVAVVIGGMIGLEGSVAGLVNLLPTLPGAAYLIYIATGSIAAMSIILVLRRKLPGRTERQILNRS